MAMKVKCTKAIYRSIIFLLFSFVFPCCENIIDYSLNDYDKVHLVVEAIITDEVKRHEVRLTQTFSSLDQKPPMVTNAEVYLYTQTDIIQFEASIEESGIFISERSFAAGINRTYTMRIIHNQDVFQATARMEILEPYNLPLFEAAGIGSLYRINWNNEKYHPFEQAMFTADISWDHLLSKEIPDSITNHRLMFFTFSTVDIDYNIFPPNQQDVLFPHGSRVVFSKYSLSNEHANYMRALLAETRWQGSLFENARSNLPGNISGEALGFFGVCAVKRDTLYVQ